MLYESRERARARESNLNGKDITQLVQNGRKKVDRLRLASYLCIALHKRGKTEED